MEFITQYTIYCTPDQTKKALELGAPIVKDCSTLLHDISQTTYINDIHYCNPITEQMIGWLEDQGVEEVFIEKIGKNWAFDLYNNKRQNITNSIESFPSRREATLAAIDAALEYLERQKK